MRTGLGRLGLSPAVFWAMTPREFDAALHGRFGVPGAAAAPTRRDLADLMRRFPDHSSRVDPP
jgi:uncharacterized phage protein (TIGR02216 family)